MSWHKFALPIFTMLIVSAATQSFGQSVNSNPFAGGMSSGGPLLRIMMMIICTALGFGLGWFLSPAAKQFRTILLLGILGLVALIAVMISGPLGWSAAMLVAIVGFAWGLGYWLKSAISGFGGKPTTFGSSRWAEELDLIAHDVFGNDGIRLGRAAVFDGVEPISYKGDRHLLTVAPTRAGKGTTQIIPNLLTYEGSMMVIDPKGENALITAKRRQDMGQKVHVVDPWGIAQIEGIEPSSFNPLDWLDLGDVDITENAMILADALVVDDNHADSFWTEEAKAILQGFILYVATARSEKDNRTLGRVRELLLQDGDDLDALFQKMVKSSHPIVSSTGARSLQKDPKLLSNVLAAAQAQTHFLDSSRLKDNLMSSDFKFEDLKTEPMTIYLVLPADRLSTFGRWLRLLVQQAITVNARNIEAKPEKPILFILDEFAALGKLSMIEQAYGLMAGFGLQLWGIIQDFNQLERIYGDGWQSFVANAGMVNYFGSSDQKTAEYFSSLCGETTVWNFSSAVASAFGTSSSTSGGSTNESITNTDTTAAAQRKLAYPDELMRLRSENQLVFIDTMYPLIANKLPWFEDEKLRPLGVNLHEEK